MKIVIVISKFSPEYSGPGVRMPKLYAYLKSVLPISSLEVVCNGIEQTINETYMYEGIKATRRSASGFAWVKILPTFIRAHVARNIEALQTYFWLRAHARDADFVHILGNSGGTVAGIFWANLKQIPVMMELVTAKAMPWQRFLFFKVMPHENSVLIALTQKTRQRCIEKGCREKSIWLRPNPIDENIFTPAAEEKYLLRAGLTPFGRDDIVVTSVAKIMPQKNQILLLKALCYLPAQFKLVIAGPFVEDGPLYLRDKEYLEAMQEIIRVNQLEERVLLKIGFVNSADYMRASDIYALPAWDEGFGTPMLEAMACGLPVVANKDETAFREWIVDGQNGFLCSIANPKEWAQGIEKSYLFPQDQRLKQARLIKARAGQIGVYQAYADLIQRLTTKRT